MNIKLELKYREKDKLRKRERRILKIDDKTKEYREYRKNNPEKVYAQQKINSLIKSGKIRRGECEFKDETCSPYVIQAHHKDYSKPLEINWLCASHHKKVDLGLLIIT